MWSRESLARAVVGLRGWGYALGSSLVIAGALKVVGYGFAHDDLWAAGFAIVLSWLFL